MHCIIFILITETRHYLVLFNRFDIYIVILFFLGGILLLVWILWMSYSHPLYKIVVVVIRKLCRNASQLQFGFICIFFSPGLKRLVWFFFSFKEKFHGYELAVLKIFKCNALVWTSLFMCFLCTMQKTPTVLNLAVRTSVPHCLLKTLHLVTLAHSSHLLLAHQWTHVCAVK